MLILQIRKLRLQSTPICLGEVVLIILVSSSKMFISIATGL